MSDASRIVHDLGTADALGVNFPETMQPGVYFQLSEEAYHADPSLSASGMRDLLLTPLTHWIRSRHLNPNYEDRDSDAKQFGKAFHKRVLEGRAAFEGTYAVMPTIADHPDALDGAAALRAQCVDMELPKGGTIAEMCERIRAKDIEVLLWSDVMAAFEDENGDKIKISREWADDIEFRAGIVERHPDAMRAFSGGYPEVSIFWRDEETGCPLKCRLDFLKPTAVIDLKTFANINDAPPTVAFMRNVVQNRNDVQAAVYRHGAEIAKGLPVTGFDGDDAWLDAFRTSEAPAFYFVAVQKGDVPNLIVREFGPVMQGQQQEYFLGAWMSYRRAVAEYCLCLDTFGREPWSPPDRAKPLVDTDFPLYHLERAQT